VDPRAQCRVIQIRGVHNFCFGPKPIAQYFQRMHQFGAAIAAGEFVNYQPGLVLFARKEMIQDQVLRPGNGGENYRGQNCR